MTLTIGDKFAPSAIDTQTEPELLATLHAISQEGPALQDIIL